MQQTAANRWSIATFGVTILVSAFLLFQVQPLVSKAILPWFGGCPAVWTTCMLFFQVVLFAGYVYAHLLQQWLSPHRQVAFHLALVVVAMTLLPIAPSDSWKPVAGSNPTCRILLLLTGTVGLPYFALSATSPLLQAWFGHVWPDRSPYRLYALSNVGSLAALLSYPFVFEPAFGLPTQSMLWSGAFVLYGLMCAATLVSLRRNASPISVNLRSLPEEGTDTSPTWFDRFRWLALPACASLMLLAVTNHVCQDVAVVPFLWVIPLALYLLSFIITFDHARWYLRGFWALAAVVTLVGTAVNDFHQISSGDAVPIGLPRELSLYFGAMFCVCMVCHGELARLKPSSRHLTDFYLSIAAGGAIGGLFVGIIAPLIFSAYLEWQISVAASFALSAGLLILPSWRKYDGRKTMRADRRATKAVCAEPSADRKRSKPKTSKSSAPTGRSGLPPLLVMLRNVLFACALVVAIGYLGFWTLIFQVPTDRARNFFGVVSVRSLFIYDPNANESLVKVGLQLQSGRISHGCQSDDPAKRRQPTTYYSETSGVGKTIRWLQKSGPIRVGAIGLGVGTLATYAKPGDVFRFYEINPEVERIAKEHFTYLADCRGKCDMVLGDARLSLESEPPQKFDLLVLDAFTGDAVPTHLLTREAFDVYERHLAPGGVIAVHVTNNYLRLPPIVRRLAENRGMQASRIAAAGDRTRLTSASVWVLATRNDAFMKAHPSEPRDWGPDNFAAPLWTDQFNNLYQVLKSR